MALNSIAGKNDRVHYRIYRIGLLCIPFIRLAPEMAVSSTTSAGQPSQSHLGCSANAGTEMKPTFGTAVAQLNLDVQNNERSG